MTAPITLQGDLLFGAAQIADFLGCSRDRVYYLVALDRLPSFRMSSVICARRSVLVAWIQSQEMKSSPKN